MASSTAESLKKCQMSCPADYAQTCGGDGAFISIYYDRSKYSPGPDTIPGFSSSSAAPSKTSSSNSKSTAPPIASTFKSAPSNPKSSTKSQNLSGSQSVPSSSSSILKELSSSPNSAKPSPTTAPTAGPTTVQNAGAYTYVGCYTEGSGHRALTGKLFAADTMTVEACRAFCSVFTWFGVQYHRECKLAFLRIWLILTCRSQVIVAILSMQEVPLQPQKRPAQWYAAATYRK